MAKSAPLSAQNNRYIEMFEQYLAEQGYLDAQGKPTKHFNKRRRSLRAFLRHWEVVYSKPFGGPMTREMILNVLMHMHQAGRVHETLEDDLAALRAFWRCLMNQPNSQMTVNLAEGLKVPGVPKSQRQKLEQQAKRLEHQILLRLDDEQYDYLQNLIKEGLSTQDVLRRIIEEHHSFQQMATALKIQQQTKTELERLFDAQTEAIKEVLYGETEARLKDTLVMQTFGMCLLMASTPKNPDYLFRATQENLQNYFDLLYERLEAEIQALRFLPGKAA